MFGSFKLAAVLCTLALLGAAQAFMASTTPAAVARRSSLRMAEVTFPNGRKVEAASGAKLSEITKKAGFKPTYACEEGKCGTCELKINGKKIRVCVGKVPGGKGPFTLTK